MISTPATQNRTFRSRRGIALVTSLLASTVMITLLLALLSTRLGEMRSTVGNVRTTQAQLIAEAGVDYVVGLAIRDNGALPDESYCSLAGAAAFYCVSDVAYAGGTFSAYAVDDGGLFSVTARAVDAHGTTRNVEVQYDLTTRNRIVDTFAMLACDDLSLSGGLRVSDGDIYSGKKLEIQTAASVVNGDALAYDDIVFTGNGSVTGNVISETGDIEIGGGGLKVRAGGYAANPFGKKTLTPFEAVGGISHDPGVYDLPDYCRNPIWDEDLEISDDDFDDYETDALAQGVHNGNVSISYGSMGGYVTSRHYIDGDLQVSGMPAGHAFDGVYFVTGDLDISGNYHGTATFVVMGNLTVTGATLIDAYTEHAFVVDGNVRLAGGAVIDGVVYTNGDIEAEGNAVVNGSVVAAGNGGISGSLQVNYRKAGEGAALPNRFLEDVTVLRWRNVF